MLRSELQPAFVLHHRPYSESSLLLELFTRDHGRVGAIAKGARRKGGQRAILQPFHSLLVSLQGRGELATLTAVETVEEGPLCSPRHYPVGFYLNELVLRLTHRHDPHPQLFQSLANTYKEITSSVEPALRRFERDLLEAVGYGLTLDHCVDSGLAIEADGDYRYQLRHGPVVAAPGVDGIPVRGASLLALAGAGEFDPQSLRELKRLMRGLLACHLGDRPLRARELFRAQCDILPK